MHPSLTPWLLQFQKASVALPYTTSTATAPTMMYVMYVRLRLYTTLYTPDANETGRRRGRAAAAAAARGSVAAARCMLMVGPNSEANRRGGCSKAWGNVNAASE